MTVPQELGYYHLKRELLRRWARRGHQIRQPLRLQPTFIALKLFHSKHYTLTYGTNFVENYQTNNFSREIDLSGSLIMNLLRGSKH